MKFVLTATLLLFIVSVAAQSQPQPADTIQPIFSCWFTTYASGTAISNVVLGYNNSFTQSQIVAPTDTTINIVLPADYNTDEYYLFQVGLAQNARSIADTLGVLRAGGVIQWIVNNASVSVSQEHLTPQARCSILYPQACPVAMTAFCSDGTYCNGVEVCFPSMLNPAIGFCMPGVQPVQCSDPTWSCSEQALACVAPAPTETPTGSPTAAPTEQDVNTTDMATASPTETPTDGVSPPPTGGETGLTCVVNSDCYPLDTFCDGAYHCLVTSQRCVRANASYDPCASARDILEAVYNATHNDTAFPLSVVCVEPRGCVLIMLNDQELTAQPSIPPPSVSSPSLDEPVGDEHNWAPHNPTEAPTVNNDVALGIGITAGILVFLGLLALIAALWYEFSASNSYLNSTALAQASLQSSAIAARNATASGSFNSNATVNYQQSRTTPSRPPHNAHTTR